MNGLRNRLQQYRIFREQNPGVSYMDWKSQQNFANGGEVKSTNEQLDKVYAAKNRAEAYRQFQDDVAFRRMNPFVRDYVLKQGYVGDYKKWEKYKYGENLKFQEKINDAYKGTADELGDNFIEGWLRQRQPQLTENYKKYSNDELVARPNVFDKSSVVPDYFGNTIGMVYDYDNFINAAAERHIDTQVDSARNTPLFTTSEVLNEREWLNKDSEYSEFGDAFRQFVDESPYANDVTGVQMDPGAHGNTAPVAYSFYNRGIDNVFTTAVHEKTHALKATPQDKAINDILGKPGFFGKSVYNRDNYDPYWDMPDEVYARLNEFRYQNELDPKKIYTKEMLEEGRRIRDMLPDSFDYMQEYLKRHPEKPGEKWYEFDDRIRKATQAFDDRYEQMKDSLFENAMPLRTYKNFHLFDRYSDEEVLELLNRVAENDKKPNIKKPKMASKKQALIA